MEGEDFYINNFFWYRCFRKALTKNKLQWSGKLRELLVQGDLWENLHKRKYYLIYWKLHNSPTVYFFFKGLPTIKYANDSFEYMGNMTILLNIMQFLRT